MKYRLIKWMALLWTILTIILSSIPNSSIPRTLFNEIFGIDKIAHVSFYFIMTGLWSLYLMHHYPNKQARILGSILSMSIGMMMEVFQGVYFPDRSFDWLDAAANGLGAFVAYQVVNSVNRRIDNFLNGEN